MVNKLAAETCGEPRTDVAHQGPDDPFAIAAARVLSGDEQGEPHRGMPLLLTEMSRLCFSAFALAVVAVSCSGSAPRDARYPRRPPGCALQIFNGLPEMKVWDDIGIVQVDCYLDESEVACLGRLHTEACRMGGDIVYNVPKKALRPIERGMIYRAQVAHTRDAKKADEAPAPAATDAGAGPIEPLLPSAPATPPAADGGGQ